MDNMKKIHYQELVDGNTKDFYLTEEEFRKEFSNMDGELWPCYHKMINNIGVWTNNGRVVSITSKGR